jgi:hypothetical protein
VVSRKQRNKVYFAMRNKVEKSQETREHDEIVFENKAKGTKENSGLENIFHQFLAAKFKNSNFLCKSSIKCKFQRTCGL